MIGSRKLAAAVALCGALAVPASAQAARSEAPAVTPAGFPDVVKSVVTIDAPLPANVGPVPAACEQLRYLRYRRDGGPSDPQKADAVLVIMPGTLAGAGSLEEHALQVVEGAAQRGRSLEYWALDRRANCLEDRTGLDAALAAGDAKVALDYYYRGTEALGRRFAGFPTRDQLRPVADFGMAQTIEDYREVIVQGLPDPAVRAEKTFCGGHSLGGALTGILMAWDFGARGHGRDLCAGSIALDSSASRFDVSAAATQQPIWQAIIRQTTGDVRNAIRANVIPRTVDFGFIGPETMLLLEGIGMNTALAPDADTAGLVARTPPTAAVDGAMRLFHSKSAADAFAKNPRLRRQHLSGAALLGAFMDDQAQPLAFIKTSIGSYTGGALAFKSFPFQTQPRMVFPTEDAKLYGWRNDEATDLFDLARILPGAPLDFLEQYYPTMLTADSILIGLGSRAGEFAHIDDPDAARVKPRLTVVAGDGLGDPKEPAGPAGVTNTVVDIPGYDHLDVITARPVQPDGAKEPSAAATLDFVLGEL